MCLGLSQAASLGFDCTLLLDTLTLTSPSALAKHSLPPTQELRQQKCSVQSPPEKQNRRSLCSAPAHPRHRRILDL